jgi:plastocyanin
MTGLPAATFTLTSGTAASVSTAGRVIAVQQGTATVTASLTSSGVTKTAMTNVNVTALQANASVTASAAGTTFDPATVKIAAGGQVTWSFPGQLHNVMWDGAVDPPGGDIGNHSNGDTEARSFPNAGSYPYHCSIHGASMNGTVTVRTP